MTRQDPTTKPETRYLVCARDLIAFYIFGRCGKESYPEILEDDITSIIPRLDLARTFTFAGACWHSGTRYVCEEIDAELDSLRDTRRINDYDSSLTDMGFSYALEHVQTFTREYTDVATEICDLLGINRDWLRQHTA